MPSNICSYACSYYNVHQRLEQLTKNILRQNDWHLADIQSASSVHRSFNPFVHGHSQVCQNSGVSSSSRSHQRKSLIPIFESEKWCFTRFLMSESRCRQEKESSNLNCFVKYLRPKLFFHFRFWQLLGMRSTFFFSKFWEWFSEILGLIFFYSLAIPEF